MSSIRVGLLIVWSIVILVLGLSGYTRDMGPKNVSGNPVRYTMEYSGYRLSWNTDVKFEAVSCDNFVVGTKNGVVSSRLAEPGVGWDCEYQYQFSSEKTSKEESYTLLSRVASVSLKLVPANDFETVVLTIQALPDMAGQMFIKWILWSVLIWVCGVLAGWVWLQKLRS